jgi:hypothetical protein
MGRPQVVLDLATDHTLARDLAAGGVFVPGCTVAVMADVELVIRAGDEELSCAARVVWHDGNGAGLELVDCTPEVKAKLAAMAAAEDERGGADADDGKPDRDPIARNIHERLRGLNLAQQVKAAQHGEISERIVLERIYGKTVWEPLLRNPRITTPEIGRIARMGALPRPMIELICGNGTWLQIPEIRRALLGNPRLGTDQIIRVLRLLPKHELKLAATLTAYPHAVRACAKKLLKELEDS